MTLRSVGSAGGEAAAFAFDLARSVVYTRQGNPAWAGQERDGVAPIRPDDLFFGAKASNPQPDWVDLNKVAIPQADEQQRLLANLITRMARDVMPIPRFWYFPRDEKAVIVMTGDDHASGGTAGRFDSQAAQSPPGCSVADWECIRSTSYIYPNTPLTDAQAAAYDAQGFEVGLHVTTNCADWTPAQLENFFSTQLADWQAEYPSVPSPVTNRTHCITWSDWASHPKTELAHGIRFDTNYYYWPPDWIQNRPGMFTGSGMPMRFADLDGTVIDVYQGATQMTDESGQTYPFTVNALLDTRHRARGLLRRVRRQHAHRQRVVGGRDGDHLLRAGARRPGRVLAADADVARRAQRVVVRLARLQRRHDVVHRSRRARARTACARCCRPSTPDGPIIGLTRGGSPVPFTVEVVKGIEYARFDAAAGNYEATYLADTDGPVITDVQADPDSDGTAVVTWTTDEPSSSRVDYGTSAGSLTSSATSPGLTTSHSVTLTGLAAATTYHYRVTSTDASANSTTEPAGTPLTFTTPFATLVDTTAADFGAGTLGAGTYLAQAGTARSCSRRLVGSEFGGSSLPAGWTSTPWNAGGASTVAGGIVTVDGALLATERVLRPRPCARVLGGHRRRGVPARRARNRPERPPVGADLVVRRQRRALYARTQQRDGDEHADRVLDRPDAPLPHRVDGLGARLLRGRRARRHASDADRRATCARSSATSSSTRAPSGSTGCASARTPRRGRSRRACSATAPSASGGTSPPTSRRRPATPSR